MPDPRPTAKEQREWDFCDLNPAAVGRWPVTIDNGELGVDYARYREPDRMLSDRVVDALEQENHLYPQVRSQVIHTRAAQAHQRHQPQRHQPAPER